MRIAINGFGRIGRSVFRILDQKKDIKVVAINDLSNQESLAYLLKYDTVMGKFSGNVNIEDNIMNTDNDSIQMLSERDPFNLPWKDLNIDVVIEATGVFTKRSLLENHLNAGAKKSGCTIHFVDESLDGGPIIAQVETTINKKMTSTDLSKKILKMEHKIYPEVVNLFAMKKISMKENKVLIKDKKKLNLFIKNI